MEELHVGTVVQSLHHQCGNLNLVRQNTRSRCRQTDTVKLARCCAYSKLLWEDSEGAAIVWISKKGNAENWADEDKKRFKVESNISARGSEDRRFSSLWRVQKSKGSKESCRQVEHREGKNSMSALLSEGLVASSKLAEKRSNQSPSLSETNSVISSAPMDKSRAWRAWQRLHFPHHIPPTQSSLHCDSSHKFPNDLMAVQMAKFRSALTSPATNNEILHRERQVHFRLNRMADGTKMAELDSRSIRGWLEVGEAQLDRVPQEAQMAQLLKLFDEAHCHDLGSHQQKKQRAKFWGWRPWHWFRSREDRMGQVLQATEQLELDLSQLSNLQDLVLQIRAKTAQLERNLESEHEATIDAVKELREAVAKGEVAWLINAEESSSRLAKTMKKHQNEKERLEISSSFVD